MSDEIVKAGGEIRDLIPQIHAKLESITEKLTYLREHPEEAAKFLEQDPRALDKADAILEGLLDDIKKSGGGA